jgi:hypothetical protein
MKRYNNPPKFMRAKYAGVCAESGKPIKPGDEILYMSGSAYLKGTKQYQEYAEAEFDRVALGHEY